MSKELDRIAAQRDKAEKLSRKYDNEMKAIEHKMKGLDRKERNHRLVVRGVLLESYLKEPELLTEENVKEILNVAFSMDAVQEKLAELIQKRGEELGNETN